MHQGIFEDSPQNKKGVVLPPTFIFGRDPFETTIEFKSRLQSIFKYPLLAGHALFIKKNYDIDAQKFLLKMQWEQWFTKLETKIDKVYICLTRDFAKRLHDTGHTHPVYIRLKLVDTPQLNSKPSDVFISVETIELHGLNQYFPLIYHREPRLIYKLEGHGNWTRAVAFTYDNGMLLASGSEDCTVKLWNLKSGQVANTLTQHQEGINCVVFSPNGKLLASCSNDATIKIWDVKTGDNLITLAGHQHTVFSVAFSPDGKLVASGGVDKTVRLWKLETSETLFTLEGHEDWVMSVAFSPDGNMLASGSRDKSIRLWNVEKGKEVLCIC